MTIPYKALERGIKSREFRNHVVLKSNVIVKNKSTSSSIKIDEFDVAKNDLRKISYA